MTALASPLPDGNVGPHTPVDLTHCASCQKELTGTWAPDPLFDLQRVCLDCHANIVDQMRKREQRSATAHKQLLLDYPIYERTFLDNAGVPMGRTRECTLEGVPKPLRECLPVTVLTAMQAGSVAQLGGEGYGMLGDTGAGKSGLNAVLAKAYYRARFMRQVETQPLHGAPDGKDHIRWISWPDAADDLSRMATSPHLVEGFLNRARRASLLILDDLGRERFSARHDEGATPLHQGLLERIIDARNELRRPIFWNSNLSMVDLGNLYGTALMGRLVQGNPPVHLPADMPNMRLR